MIISTVWTENQAAGSHSSMQLDTDFSSWFATDCLSDALLGEGNPLCPKSCGIVYPVCKPITHSVKVPAVYLQFCTQGGAGDYPHS